VVEAGDEVVVEDVVLLEELFGARTK